jgi:hypothetical protein
MTTDNFCFYLQNRLIQTSQTGGQQYSDTSPFSIPCCVSTEELVPGAPLTNDVGFLREFAPERHLFSSH